LIPEQALDLLNEGNARFAAGASIHPNLTERIRIETFENGQKPLCAILSCADSRAPVELVFDRGIGDIFSVRNAGNVADEVVQGSLELGIYKFGIPLLIVMGHTDCGAIKCAVDGDRLHGSMPKVIDRIIPVVEAVRQQRPGLSKDELVLEVTKANARHVLNELTERSDVFREKIAGGELKVMSALHDLKSGKVEWFN